MWNLWIRPLFCKHALTLSGGLAWLGLLSIVYLVGDILERLGDWIIKKRNNKE